MLRNALLATGFAASLALATSASSLAAATVEITANNPVIELSVFEQIEVAPDIVTIGAGVTTEASTAVEALRKNSAEMRRVVDLVKALGVEPRDIQTTGINLNAQYDYDRSNQRQVFRAYQASNRISVRLREIDRAGEVLDALVSAGATNIFGPNFSLDDDTAAKGEARARAMTNARNRAEAYARLAGYSSVRILQISESIRSSGPREEAIVQTASRMADAAAPTAPIEPGMVSAGVSVSVTFEMTGQSSTSSLGE